MKGRNAAIQCHLGLPGGSRLVGIILSIAVGAFAASCAKKAALPSKAPPPLAVKKTATGPFRPSQTKLSRLRSALSQVNGLAAASKTQEAQAASQRVVVSYLTDPTHRVTHPEEYQLLSTIVRAGGAKKDREDVAKSWLAAFDGNPAHRAAMNWPRYIEFGQLLLDAGREKDAGRIAQIAAERLRANEKGQPTPAFLEVRQLMSIARRTGSTELQAACKQRLVALCGGENGFPKQSAPLELISLANEFRQKKDTTNFELLSSFIAGEYFPQPGLVEALYPQEYLGLLKIVAESGGERSRNAMLDGLQDHLTKDRLRVQVFSRGQLAELAESAAKLGAGTETRDVLVSKWLAIDEAWQDMTPESRELISSAAVARQAPLAQDLFKKLNERFLARCGTGSLCLSEYRGIFALCKRTGRATEGAAWAKRAFDRTYASAEQDIPLSDFGTVVGMLADAGVVLDESAAVRLFQELMLWKDKSSEVPDELYANLGRLFRAGPGERLLNDHLVGEDGRVNLPAAKALAWLEKAKGARSSFLVRLKQMTGKVKPQGDDLALWELAQAYAVSLESDARPIRTWGNEHIRLALAAARSDQIRRQCIAELAAACRAEHRYQAPIQAIQSTKEQFGAKEKADLELLLQALIDEESAWKEQASARQVEMKNTLEWRRLFGARSAKT